MFYVYNSKTETFWTTTGMFPQSFIISFQSEMTLKSIQIFCSNGMNVNLCSEYTANCNLKHCVQNCVDYYINPV